jgi:plastocyanin
VKSQFPAITIATLLTATQAVAAENLNISVTNPDGSPVSGIIAYATPVDMPLPPQRSNSIQLAQKDRAFSSFIIVVQRGDEVDFINQDDFTHHIYSISEQNRFSFKLKASESHTITPSLASEQATEISMGCNIHDWMSGYILVVDTPYFNQTDKQGTVKLELAQPGRYQVTLWHPQLEVEQHQLSRMLDVQADSNLNWQLPVTLEVALPEVDEEEFNFLNKY